MNIQKFVEKMKRTQNILLEYFEGELYAEEKYENLVNFFHSRTNKQ